ncbi:hypothetical protein [Streptosporangium subroseum]|uniref:hypothetical protein n=1 Tax=Streptosporangium subroseum TaxID=106412 RepID=UPI00308F2F7A|nr:hypothetical protein OHB15_43810 [Streptosporangium subroseum]
MIPEFHSQMIVYRMEELHAKADNYRLVREAQEADKKLPKAKRRWSLFGKIIPA